MVKKCEYCGREYEPPKVTERYQKYCGYNCRQFGSMFNRQGTRHCWRCGLLLKDNTGSRICKSCRKFLNRRAKMPTLDDLTPDELLRYGKTQARYYSKGGVLFG